MSTKYSKLIFFWVKNNPPDSLFRNQKGKEKDEKIDIKDQFILDFIESRDAEDNNTKEQMKEGSYIKSEDLIVFDEGLQKVTHFYELVCLGYISPSLIRLLTLKKSDDSDLFYRKYNPDHPGELEDYGILMSVISLIFGDYEKFIKYNGKFLEKIGLRKEVRRSPKERDDRQQEEKDNKLSNCVAIRSMMLVHGPNYLTSAGKVSGVSEEYEKIFEIFGGKKKAVMDLHMIFTRTAEELFNLSKPQSLVYNKNYLEQGISKRREKFHKFWKSKLNMSMDSIQWLNALLWIAHGDTSRVDFISEQYEASAFDNTLLKALWSRNIEEMILLFEEVHSLVNNLIM